MPWPLIPIAAAGAALLAGCSKIAASSANSRAERVASSVKAADSKARAKNEQFRETREQIALEFSTYAETARGELAEYVAKHQILDSETAQATLPTEIREALGDLSIAPPPIVDLKRCSSGEAMIQSSAKVLIQAQNLQRSHPKAGGAMQTVAMLGAVTGYIDSNFERVKQVDDYEGKAKAYVAEVESLVATFDSAFQRDLEEDRRTAERVGGYVRNLLMLQAGERGEVARSRLVVNAVAFADYLGYLDGLVSRYRLHSDGAANNEQQ